MLHAVLALAFALVAASAPRPLACAIQLRDSPHGGRARSWRFVGGQGLVLIGAAAFVVITSRVVIATGAAPNDRIDTSDVLLGSLILVSLVVGAAHWWRHGRQLVLLHNHMNLTPQQSLMAGVRVLATNVSSLALFIAAINEIVLHGGTWTSSYLLLLAVIVLMLLPAMVPPVIDALLPTTVDRVLPMLFRWATTSAPVASGVLLAASGVFLLVRGLTP